MSVFAIRGYRQLFSAQAIALSGTGVATVVLALLAYELAGRKGSAVLAAVLTLKLVMTHARLEGQLTCAPSVST